MTEMYEYVRRAKARVGGAGRWAGSRRTTVLLVVVFSGIVVAVVVVILKRRSM